MTNLRQRPTVLIVDSDPAFVLWLSEIFNEAGCTPIPALDCAQAVSITQELCIRLAVQLTVLVVNPGLFGVAWMIHTLWRTQGPFRVISLIDNETDVTNLIWYEDTLKRPRQGEPLSREKWLEQARRMLRDLLKFENGKDG